MQISYKLSRSFIKNRVDFASEQYLDLSEGYLSYQPMMLSRLILSLNRRYRKEAHDQRSQRLDSVKDAISICHTPHLLWALGRALE